jgi:hypothetical protein
MWGTGGLVLPMLGSHLCLGLGRPDASGIASELPVLLASAAGGLAR